MLPSSPTFRTYLTLLGVLAGTACARAPRPVAGPSGPTAPTAEPRNGLEVIGWMRFRHPSRDLRTLAFTVTRQRATDSASVESVSYARLPGAMRTDAITGTRLSLVQQRHRASVFRNGRRISTLHGVDLRTLLAFDVFAEAIDTTIMWLDSAHVRFGLARKVEWQGRHAWVVGALAGDDTSTQFWVDAEQWRLLRVIQREPTDPHLLSDVRFVGYDELLETPVPTRIEVWRDGRLSEVDALSGFRVNPDLPSRAFDLARLRRVSIAPTGAR